MKKIDPLKILIAQTVVLIDILPKKCDAIFIHAVPIQDNLLKNKHLSVIKDIYKKGFVKTIFLNPLTQTIHKKYKMNLSYGYENLRKNLIKNGISKKDIQTIPASFDTASESREFLKLAKEKKWKKLIISSQPHHQLRCFLQIIEIMKEMNFYPKVYNLTHYEVPWNKIFRRPILNNKSFEGKFSDHIKSEYERIVKYSKPPKFDEKFTKHTTIKEMLSYLDWREQK